MDALQFIKNFRRFCYSQDDCTTCPCFTDNDENCNILSMTMTNENIIKHIEIIEKWTEEHPTGIASNGWFYHIANEKEILENIS